MDEGKQGFSPELTVPTSNGALSSARPVALAEVLNAAADLLERPGAWRRWSLATDADGRSVPPKSPAACQWCIAGAIQRFAPDGPPFSPYIEAVEAVIDECAAMWNDRHSRTAPEVVKALRDAALSSERAGQGPARPTDPQSARRRPTPNPSGTES
jgi:hypothetical protein